MLSIRCNTSLTLEEMKILANNNEISTLMQMKINAFWFGNTSLTSFYNRPLDSLLQEVTYLELPCYDVAEQSQSGDYCLWMAFLASLVPKNKMSSFEKIVAVWESLAGYTSKEHPDVTLLRSVFGIKQFCPLLLFSDSSPAQDEWNRTMLKQFKSFLGC